MEPEDFAIGAAVVLFIGLIVVTVLGIMGVIK